MCYNCLLRACAVRGDVNAAKSWFSALLSNGHTPSTITYNCMASAFLRAGSVHQALDWLVRMLKENCQPDAVTQAILQGDDPETGASLSASMCLLILKGLPVPLEDYVELFQAPIPDKVTNVIKLQIEAASLKAQNIKAARPPPGLPPDNFLVFSL